MLLLDSALRHSAVIMMKCLMQLSTALEINSQPLPLMVSQECIMCSLELVLPYSKVTRTKYLRFNSTHKEIKSSQPQVTRLAEFGTLIREPKSRYLMVTRMRFSHALSTTRETP
jgi:hypothetical protein